MVNDELGGTGDLDLVVLLFSKHQFNNVT